MNTYQPSPQTQQLLADLEAAAGATYGMYWDWHEVAPMPTAVDDAMYYARLLALRARMVRIYMALARGGVALVNPTDQYEGMVAYENPDLTGAFRAWLSGTGTGYVKANGETILARGTVAPSDMVRQFQTGQELAIPTVAMRPELLTAPVVTAAPATTPAQAPLPAPTAAPPAAATHQTASQVPSGPMFVYSGGAPAPVAAALVAPLPSSREGGPYWWQGALIRTTPATVMPVATEAQRASGYPVVMPAPPRSDWWTWMVQNQALAFGGAAVAVVMLAALASGGRR